MKDPDADIIAGEYLGDIIDHIDVIMGLKDEKNETVDSFCYQLYDDNGNLECYTQRWE